MKRLALCLLLAGCAGKPPVQVSVPVAVPCLAPSQVPPLPAKLPPLPDDANSALSLALDSLLEWRVYGGEADAKLRACATLK